MRNATAIDYVMIAYFIAMVVIINWKGSAFLGWDSRWGKMIVALGFFIPWALYVIAAHL